MAQHGSSLRGGIMKAGLALAAAGGAWTSPASAQVQVIFPDRYLEAEAVVLRQNFSEVQDDDFIYFGGSGPWNHTIEARVNTGPSFVRGAASLDTSWTASMMHIGGAINTTRTIGAPDLDGWAYAGGGFIACIIVDEPVQYRIVGQSDISSFDGLACFYIDGPDGSVADYLDDSGPVDQSGMLLPGEYEIVVDGSIDSYANGGLDQVTFDWTITFTSPPVACPGDADGDLAVDFADLNLLLAHWSETTAPGMDGDVDGSGMVDFADLNLLLAHWGENCAGS
ncbi:MAG: hypothetical protein KDA21_15155 [Phycisphaerales bacterium]|nr:hypothetical protein [Phycisphaerales bacterium]